MARIRAGLAGDGGAARRRSGGPRSAGWRTAGPRPGGGPGRRSQCSKSPASRSRIRRRGARSTSSPASTSPCAPGEAASIVGPSGSGKSTLLYVLGRARAAHRGHRHPGRRPTRSPSLPPSSPPSATAGSASSSRTTAAAAVYGARERVGPDPGGERGRPGRGTAPANCSSGRVSATASTTVPGSCPGESGSGPRSPVP